MTKLTGAALDRAVANALGVKSVHDCEQWQGAKEVAADDGDFYGLPCDSVSSSNVDGNGVTDGETSP